MSDNFDYVDANLNEVEAWDGEYQLPEPGDYRVTVKTAKHTTSKSKGTPQIQVQFEVEANADGTTTNSKGRSATAWYQVQGQGRSRLVSLLKAANVKIDARGGFKISELENAKLLILVKSDSYKKMETDSDGDPTEKEVATVRISKERRAS
jgi:hypothetical protein